MKEQIQSEVLQEKTAVHKKRAIKSKKMFGIPPSSAINFLSLLALLIVISLLHHFGKQLSTEQGDEAAATTVEQTAESAAAGKVVVKDAPAKKTERYIPKTKKTKNRVDVTMTEDAESPTKIQNQDQGVLSLRLIDNDYPVEELDSETARQRYIVENRLGKKAGARSDQISNRIFNSNDYIPFEKKTGK